MRKLFTIRHRTYWEVAADVVGALFIAAVFVVVLFKVKF